MGAYDKHPRPFLKRLHKSPDQNPESELYCAGFEFEEWRCSQFAEDLIGWLPDYGLIEEELQINHANAYQKLREAAVRVYSSQKYKKRGEAGEIALHSICRIFFKTIPISPRVFYKSASNDVIKSFDLVHARFPDSGGLEIWLGESKLYRDRDAAIKDAIASINDHLERGFLKSQKLILGPQIPKSTPRYDELLQIFESQTSLDNFLKAAVFVVGIVATSDAIQSAKSTTPEYVSGVSLELGQLSKTLVASGLPVRIKLALVYIPLKDKDLFVTEFDRRLKGLQ